MALGNKPKLWPYFRGCIGALDGTYIPISLPEGEQPAWRDRKGNISQNVLAACDFDLNTVLVVAGMEGSANDSRVFLEAKRREPTFVLPPGCYFLADGGYSPRYRDLLVPYSGLRYHLREIRRAGQRQPESTGPKNARERYNVRHSGPRSAI